MRRPLLLLVLASAAVLLAGCGGSKHAASTTTTTTSALPSPADILGPGGKALYVGGDWAVVQLGSKAVAAHYVGGAWHTDTSGKVKVDVLGPNGKAAKIPQVAAEMTGKTRLVEEGLWIDGVELLEKGGGLKPTQVTAYGAPDTALKPGRHVAVAYARTATAATAVAWTFTVG